jgi:hypothetical protein
MPALEPLFSGDFLGKKPVCSKRIPLLWLNLSRLPARMIFS